MADPFANHPLGAVPELRSILTEQRFLEQAPGSDEYRLSATELLIEEVRCHGPMSEDELTEVVTAKLLDRDLVEIAAQVGLSVVEVREHNRELIARGLVEHVESTEYYRFSDLTNLREEAGLPLTGPG